MAAAGLHFHQAVFAILGVQGEGLPHQNRCGDQPEPDTYPLVDTNQIHDYKEDKDGKQTSYKYE